MKLIIAALAALVGFAAGILAGAEPANRQHTYPRVTAAPATSPATTPATAPTTATPTASPSTTEQPPVIDLTWGTDATPPSPSWTKPPLFTPTVDPVYGTPVRRVSSADGTRFNRNTYSRRQAENADSSFFMTYHGDAEYRVYDRASGALVVALPIHPDAEPQWHPTDPSIVRYIDGPNSSSGSLRLHEYDISAASSNVIADLTVGLQATWPSARYMADRAEGSPSADGDRYAWIIFDGNEDPLGIASFDLATGSIIGTLPLRTDAGPLDWVSASATGEYVVAGHWNGTFVYDAVGLGNGRRLNDKGDHSDIALDAEGGDAYVAIDFSTGPNAGWLTSIDLDTLEVTRIFSIYGGSNTSVHVSGKGFDRPGWVIVSTYNCKDPGAWTCEKVMAVEMAPGGRVLNLAHTYNCGDNYWTETHAVVNRSFTRVYFNSDGGSCGIDAEVYELTVPAFD